MSILKQFNQLTCNSVGFPKDVNYTLSQKHRKDIKPDMFSTSVPLGQSQTNLLRHQEKMM